MPSKPLASCLARPLASDLLQSAGEASPGVAAFAEFIDSSLDVALTVTRRVPGASGNGKTILLASSSPAQDENVVEDSADGLMLTLATGPEVPSTASVTEEITGAWTVTHQPGFGSSSNGRELLVGLRHILISGVRLGPVVNSGTLFVDAPSDGVSPVEIAVPVTGATAGAVGMASNDSGQIDITILPGYEGDWSTLWSYGVVARDDDGSAWVSIDVAARSILLHLGKTGGEVDSLSISDSATLLNNEFSASGVGTIFSAAENSSGSWTSQDVGNSQMFMGGSNGSSSTTGVDLAAALEAESFGTDGAGNYAVLVQSTTFSGGSTHSITSTSASVASTISTASSYWTATAGPGDIALVPQPMEETTGGGS